MIEIVNRQRRRKLNSKELRIFSERALRAIDCAQRDATIVFVSDRSIKDLNRRFRGKARVTDVLSFPTNAERFEKELWAHLGEVVISADRAMAQAKQDSLSFANEMRQLILHGLLHLCGYDHETDNGEMNRLELKI